MEECARSEDCLREKMWERMKVEGSKESKVD